MLVEDWQLQGVQKILGKGFIIGKRLSLYPNFQLKHLMETRLGV